MLVVSSVLRNRDRAAIFSQLLSKRSSWFFIRLLKSSRVHSRKILKYINLSIAVLLVAGVVVVYWIAYRPLPQVSGGIRAPISRQATIARDALGVPHIAAATWEDAIFLQGFVTAQDRLWQMDAMRRAAAGDLAEVFGTVGLEADRDARRFRFRRIAEAHYRTLSAPDRGVLAAYARGSEWPPRIRSHLQSRDREGAVASDRFRHPAVYRAGE